MKKLGILILFSICCHAGSAQRFSLNELLKLNNNSFDDFNDLSVSKGYKLYEVDGNDRAEFFTYAYGQNRSNIYASRVVSKFNYKQRNKQIVSFQTLNSGDFLYIKDQLQNLRFSFINNKTNKNGVKFSVYRKGNTEVSLASDNAFNASGERITYYHVLVASDTQ